MGKPVIGEVKQPEDIYAERARGSTFDDFKAQMQTFAKALEESGPHKDGLNYVHSALRRICELARLLSEQSPIAAEPIIIHESEMMGACESLARNS
jgi:hypothetical protein